MSAAAHTPDALASALPAEWHVAEDSDGEPTLWRNNLAILERRELSPAGKYGDLLWAVLTRVLAPDEATVERLADRLLAQGGHAEYASEKIREIARDDVRIVLAALGALEQTGPDGEPGEAVSR